MDSCRGLHVVRPLGLVFLEDLRGGGRMKKQITIMLDAEILNKIYIGIADTGLSRSGYIELLLRKALKEGNENGSKEE